MRWICTLFLVSGMALGQAADPSKPSSPQPDSSQSVPATQAPATNPAPDVSSQPPTPTPTAASAPAASTAHETAAQTQPPDPNVIPAGARIPLLLKQAISTKNARDGDAVYAETAFPFVVNERILVPAGTYIQGKIAHVERAGEKFEGVSGEMKTLVPKKAMDELKSLLDSDVETIDFAKDESTLFFRVGPRLLTSRQLTGQFPNYEAVLPKDISKSIALHGEELGAAIARVAQFADERSRAVRLRLEKGELKISASSTETGESEDSIEVAYDGEPMAIGFNAQYLMDFIKATGSCEVKLELKDAQSAGQLRPAEGEDYKYRYIVMPMRI